MDNQQATQVELAWLAGMLEGDGTLNLRLAWCGRKMKRRYVQTPIEFTNTDKAIIEHCVMICKKLGVNLHVKHTTQLNGPEHKRKVVSTARSHSMAGAMKILPALLPFLVGEKKERARLVLSFVGSRKQQLESGHRSGWHNDVPYTQEQMDTVVSCQHLVSPWKSSESIRLELADNRRAL